MGNVVIASLLSLFLGPGVGQLYNRDFKKGIYLLVVSLIVFVALCVWCLKASQPYLPTDLTTVDPTALQSIITNAATQVAKSHSATLAVYKYILIALWVYSVYDAATVAARRRPPSVP